MRNRRPLPYTRFNFDDFFDDPAVMVMTNEQVGAYLRLLRAAWKADPPGHLPNDDTYLAAASGLGKAWPDHRETMVGPFKLLGGKLVQSRIVREYEVARGCSMMRSTYGVAGAKVRWHGHGQAMARQWPNTRERDRDREESTSTPFVTADALTVTRAASTDSGKAKSAEWDDALSLLWPDFPRKVGKPAALRAWRAIKPQTQETFDAIDAGLARWLDYWRGKDRQHVCHPATWLNQRRWEDEP